jgi:uncharacterized protein
MEKHVLFIQGAGDGAYRADKDLAESLQKSLGSDYRVHYPAMPEEDKASYDQWKQQIEKELATIPAPIVFVGHSVGAAVLTKFLSEIELTKSIAGIFLLETPFWGRDGWLYEGYEQLELPKDTATKFPKGAPIFLYHSRADETVPFAHVAL